MAEEQRVIELQIDKHNREERAYMERLAAQGIASPRTSGSAAADGGMGGGSAFASGSSSPMTIPVRCGAGGSGAQPGMGGGAPRCLRMARDGRGRLGAPSEAAPGILGAVRIVGPAHLRPVRL